MLRQSGVEVKAWSLFKSTFSLYRDGFRSMGIGKTLWKIIAVKLVIIFLVFKLFLFPDVLQKAFETDGQRSEHVASILAHMPPKCPGNPCRKDMLNKSQGFPLKRR